MGLIREKNRTTTLNVYAEFCTDLGDHKGLNSLKKIFFVSR